MLSNPLAILLRSHLRHPTKPLGSPAPKAPIEVLGRIASQPTPPIRAYALALLLRAVDFLLQLHGARVDELELRKLAVKHTDHLRQGIVGLAGLAECLRCGVDLLDHLSEILVELVEAVLEFFSELVTRWC
jgi:hypothetical protein